MNIGIVTTWFERGAAYVSQQYYKVLCKQFNVFIFARGGEEYAIGNHNWDIDNVHWSKRYIDAPWTYFDLSEFEEWIERKKIDCVFFNEQIWWEPVLFCNRKQIKCGAYIDYYKQNTVSFFKHYDFIICNTMRHFSVFEKFPQTYYVPWGTDIDVFKPVCKDKLNNEQITYFHSAGYNPIRKGTEILIKAFDKLSSQYKSKCKLIIHTQVALEKKLPKEVINILEENKNIVIIEKTVGAPGLYYLGDVYVYPSKLDGIGLTVAEALSCGLPVIVSDNAPMIEFGSDEIRKKILVKNYISREDGYYWPEVELDIDSLVKQMEFFLLTDNLNIIKKKAREYAEKKLNWNNNSKKIRDIFVNSVILPHDFCDEMQISILDKSQFSDDNIYLEYKQKLDKIKAKLIKIKNSSVFFAPAGSQTQKIIQLLDRDIIKIKGLLDSKKEGFSIKGINTYNYSILDEESNINSTVVITSMKFSDEIESLICNLKGFCGQIVKLYDSEKEML